MTFSTEFLFRFFGSYLPAGSIAVLNFSLRVMLILVGVFGQAVGTASFPVHGPPGGGEQPGRAEPADEPHPALPGAAHPGGGAAHGAEPRGGAHPLPARALRPWRPRGSRPTCWCGSWPGRSRFAAYTVVVRGYFATRNTLFPARLRHRRRAGRACRSTPRDRLLMGVAGVAPRRSRCRGSCRSRSCSSSGAGAAATPARARSIRFYLKIGACSAAAWRWCLARGRRTADPAGMGWSARRQPRRQRWSWVGSAVG
ncbi:MAG: hypothetical protein MZV70_60645 [Desulfobacterales bacterium]|nr:hypothetical protein [Desulfobacterales bacterium]